MSVSPCVFDATTENFRALVLENSDKGPVPVNYWSPRAGPCLMLMPRLVRLAGEFGGRFLLVMLNTDELGRLAREAEARYTAAIQAYQRGDLDQAVTQAALAEPGKPRLALDLAKLLVLQQRYAQAVRMCRDDYEGALEQLLELVRRDDNFRDQAGRNSLLAIFSILGEEDERVRRYRALLQQAMH